MNSIVINLQKDIINISIPLSTLLRTALLISSKLDLIDIQSWINNESNGYYTDGIEIPSYRLVSGEMKAYNPYNGIWMPIDFSHLEDTKFFSLYPLKQSISELEAILKNENNEKLYGHYPPELKQIFLKEGVNYDITFHFTKSQIHGILNQVRNILLKWSLTLEKQGILGNDIEFSQEEIKKTDNIVINNFYKDVIQSQINSNTDNSKQINEK